MFKDVNIHIKKDGLWKPVYEDGFWYLHFPAGGPSGITSNRVEARKTSDFEIGSYPSDIEIGIRLLDEKTAYVLGSANYSGASVGYIWGVVGSSLLSSVKGSLGNSVMQPSVASLLFDKEWHQWRIVYEDGESIGYVDGNEYSRVLNENMAGDSIVNGSILKIGVQGVGRNFPLHGDIAYFRFNDEYFDFSEGSGDTIVSNFGTVMDIRGDVEWRYQEPIKNVKLYTGLGWKDLIEDEGWYLHFPGDNNSYVMARDITDLEVGVGDLDAEVRVRINEDQPSSWSSIIQTRFTTSQDGWGFTRRNRDNSYQSTITYDGSSLISAYSSDDTTWIDLQVLYENSTGTNTFIVDGDIVQIMQNDHFENINLENGHILSMGRYRPGAGTTYMLKGDISYFRFNDEEFLMNEGQGTTITGSKGTVMDILGDVEWRRDPSVMKVKIKKTPYVRLSDDTLGQFSEMSMNPMSKLNISNYYEIKFRRIAGGATLFDNIKVFDQGDYNQFRLSIRPFGELISRVSLYVYDGISSTYLSSEYTTRDWSVVRVEVSDDELHLYVDGEFKESMDLSNPIETTDPYFLSNVFYFFNYNYRNEYPSTIDISYIEIDGERFDFVGGGDTVLGSGGSEITLSGNYTWH